MGDIEKKLFETQHKLEEEISLRKSAEAEARQGKKKFSHLVELMNEGLVIKDMDKKILYANQHLLKILQLPRNQVIDHAFTNFVCVDGVGAFNPNIDEYFGSSSKFKMLRQGSSPFWVKYSPQPLFDENNQAIGCFAIITDINDQVVTNERLVKTEVKMRALAKQVLYAQEIERRRIASELHDGIGQSLSAIKFYVENNLRDVQGSDCPSLENLKTTVPKLQDAIEEVRRISMALRPSLLDDIGVLATLSWFCRESHAAHPHIKFLFDVENVNESDIQVALKTEIFRIVQEAVNNATKYSEASEIKITLVKLSNQIRLEIIDNGIGFDYAEISGQLGFKESKGMGLVSMRERAENSNGHFSVISNPANGTRLIFEWFNQCDVDLAKTDERRRASDRRQLTR